MGYLFYQVFKLLRGTIAFSIVIGVVLMIFASWLVQILHMDLLSMILNQFVSIGVIILVIIFQPELRRFLILLGKTTLKGRNDFFSKIFTKNSIDNTSNLVIIAAIDRAVMNMASIKLGALIVFVNDLNVEEFSHTGIRLDASISQSLIESIFQKTSPLHDGALLIYQNRIHSAGCILPVSNSTRIPKQAGLRHRAALGATENSSVSAIIVSEENGSISFAEGGVLHYKLTEEELMHHIKNYLKLQS